MRAILAVWDVEWKEESMPSDEQLIADARAYVDEVWEDVVRDIDYLVQVESVEDKDHASSGKPFGPAPFEAMSRGLRIAERLGLETHDCEGFIGYADVPGKGDTYLATIAHSDIVPLGEGWTVDPLSVTRKDGYLLGRGVIDDKGPLVLSLYAAHYFVRQVRSTGKMLPYTLRCLVGTNEETGMEDVEYYLSKFPEPAFCFSPDAVFPLICGEKGVFHASVTSAAMPAADARIVSFEGGTVPNAIPSTAAVTVVATEEEVAPCDGISVKSCGTTEDGEEAFRIVATGRGGHASMPEGTKNAIGMLVSYLLKHGLCNAGERRFLEFEDILMTDTQGAALGIAATDDVFDPLTCVGGTIRTMRDKAGIRFVQTMDVRYPKSTTGERVLETVKEVAERFACEVEVGADMVPFYVSPECDEIRTLVGTYNELTGRSEQAFTIGGGTYARHFARAAAFGPDDTHEDKPAWVGIEHGPDEGVSEESLKRALAIYIVSIARLMRLTY